MVFIKYANFSLNQKSIFRNLSNLSSVRQPFCFQMKTVFILKKKTSLVVLEELSQNIKTCVVFDKTTTPVRC